MKRTLLTGAGVLALLWAATCYAQPFDRQDVVEALLKRSHCLADVHFSVSQQLYRQNLRALSDRAEDHPPPVDTIGSRCVYRLSVSADGQVTLAAEVRLLVLAPSGRPSVPVLPADLTAMTNQPVLLGFRYVGAELSIPLAIRKHGEVPMLVTVADSALLTGIQLNDGRRMTKVIYSVRNNRNQFLRLKMPADAEIWSVLVAGKTVSPSKDKQGNVLIPLVRSRSSASELVAFPVTLVYVQTRVRKTGQTPIRVCLPIHGNLFKLQKILALPDDKLWFQVDYSGWKVSK
ncbi:MAG: hypothetical protein QF577_01105 [Phycisphaerae bacterium]|nr:hypothetical protein [Phycisphaerae bacterium]MDP7636122.1 hypothetical protein [Phycisphaerae bacterium]